MNLFNTVTVVKFSPRTRTSVFQVRFPEDESVGEEKIIEKKKILDPKIEQPSAFDSSSSDGSSDEDEKKTDAEKERSSIVSVILVK